jgi:osmotically-inducible protein OsmY
MLTCVSAGDGSALQALVSHRGDRPVCGAADQSEDSMRTDQDIKQDVELELRYDPDIDATDIGVAVKDGVVTLAGFVHSYSHKWTAERDAKKVRGVRAVANDLEVRLPAVDERPDPDIARDVARDIKHTLPFAAQHIKATVRNGWVTLEGEVEWRFQSENAEWAARRVKGVKGVSNLVTIKPKVKPADVQRQIEDALKRNAELEAKNITVTAQGGEVILRGTVRSWAEREEADRAAWRAPGVVNVDNQIVVKVDDLASIAV